MKVDDRFKKFFVKAIFIKIAHFRAFRFELDIIIGFSIRVDGEWKGHGSGDTIFFNVLHLFFYLLPHCLNQFSYVAYIHI